MTDRDGRTGPPPRRGPGHGRPVCPVGDVVAAAQRVERPDDVVAVIHGTTDPAVIADQIDGVLVAVGRRAPVVACRFHVASVGSVTGVVLADGDDLVVKAYQPAWRCSFLRAVVEVQARLADGGIPCATPVGGPVRCGRGFATVETNLADPGQPDAFGERERSASAEGLAGVVGLAGRDDRLADHPLRRPHPGLYPPPHSPLFDFEATADGAGWIDDLARVARSHRRDTPMVTAHTDWTARNVRLRADGVCAVYDLDSLAAVSLPSALGLAASTWRALGVAGEPAAPDLDEIEDWFERYPAVLSVADRRAALAAALYGLCYTARCEHAIDPAEELHRRARPTLRLDADRYRRALTG